MKYILADTGFWIALFSDKGSREFSIANEIFLDIQKARYKILVPYSIYSELLRKRYFFKRDKKQKTEHLESLLESGDVEKWDDARYNEQALRVTLRETKMCKEISYVDNIIRLMIEDLHDDIQFLSHLTCLISMMYVQNIMLKFMTNVNKKSIKWVCYLMIVKVGLYAQLMHLMYQDYDIMRYQLA